jgi:hypothetical protein
MHESCWGLSIACSSCTFHLLAKGCMLAFLEVVLCEEATAQCEERFNLMHFVTKLVQYLIQDRTHRTIPVAVSSFDRLHCDLAGKSSLLGFKEVNVLASCYHTCFEVCRCCKTRDSDRT